MPGPLEGIRVLDLSQVVSGPLATQMLAEQGAEIFKIEPLDGELVRTTGPDHIWGLYANCNRGKRCLSVDLEVPEAVSLVLKLAATCDVFVENFRPGVTERLGLGFDAVRARRPDIVYCSISGFGPDGPYADRPVLDPVIQAICGMVAGQASESLPFPDLIRTLVADKATAYTAAQAVTAALFARERGHGGQLLEIPMLDASLAWFWPDGMSDLTHLDATMAPVRVCDRYLLVDTLDGQIVYFIATDRQVRAMWRSLGRADLLDDPELSRIRPITLDPALAQKANEAILGGIAKLTTAETVQRFNAEGIPCGQVLGRSEVLRDPQVIHNETIVEWEHPLGGAMRGPRPPVRFAQTPAQFLPDVATTGAHSEQILRELGCDDERIAELRRKGAIAG